METLVAVVHIIISFILIGLVLVQDSKGGGALGMGGGSGSNSLLGATGAQTLAARLTRWMAVIFAMTSISLTYFSGQQGRSVLDGGAVSGPVIPPASGAPGAPGMPATPAAPAAEAPVAAPTGAPAEAPAAH